MDSTTLQIGIAAGSALLGFASSYTLERIKRRREPNRQISWDANTEQGIVETHPDLRQSIDIRYKGSPVSSLTAVTCRITNTGNMVVKNQQVRFAFPVGTTLLDASLDPVPQREIGAIREVDQEMAPLEAIYKISHLERGQDVVVKLLATGKEASNWQVFPFNEDGDVDFQERDNSRRREDKEHVVPFLTILTAMILFGFIATPLASNILLTYILSLVELTLAILLSSHVLSMARWIRDTLSGDHPPFGNSVHSGEGAILQVGGNVSGDIHFARPKNSKQQADVED